MSIRQALKDPFFLIFKIVSNVTHNLVFSEMTVYFLAYSRHLVIMYTKKSHIMMSNLSYHSFSGSTLRKRTLKHHSRLHIK